MKTLITFLYLIFFVSNIYVAQEQKSQEQIEREQIETNLLNEIYAKYGSIYSIDFLDMKYTLGYRDHIDKYTFLDPYKTLEGCALFAAERKADAPDSVNGIMGVYKDGRILWETGPIVNDFFKFGGYLSTLDFNNDGKVEIVYSWITRNASEYVTYFVYSWDGTRGFYLSEINAGGYNTFIGNIDGDKTTEICLEKPLEENQNPGENHQNEEYGEVTYVPYGYYKCTGEFTETNSFNLPKDRLDINLKCGVEKKEGRYNYKYILKNKIGSLQDIENFYIKAPENRDSLSSMFAPKNWSGGGIEFLDGWFIMYNHDYAPEEIKPGVEKDSFSISTVYLPSIVQYFVQGLNGPEDNEASKIMNNSLKGLTLGQSSFPIPFISHNQIDTLLFETDKSFELGWIREQSVRDKYKGYLSSSKDLIKKKNSAEARKYLQDLLSDADKDSSAVISTEAYALLKYNTEYILNKLPSTYKIDIKINGNGSIEKHPEQTEYDSASTVVLVAKPSEHYKFIGWSGDVTAATDTINVLMNSSMNITASYIPTIKPIGITLLSPLFSIQGTKALTLDIKGFGFLSTTIININGASKQTTFLSDSLVTLALNQSDLSKAGAIELKAENIDGGKSNSAILKIMSRTEAVDSLISMLNKANETGQLKNRGIYNSLLAKLGNLKKDLEKNNLSSAAGTLNAFINELKAQNGKGISESAYNGLKSLADLILKSF